MAHQSSEEFKELVRSRTEIVNLIGEGISLQARHGGKLFVGLCPFHDDSNPSLQVYPERQSFKCWACNTGGDCFEYVMQSERVGFREALELLATRANLELPKTHRRSEDNNGPDKSQLYEAVAWAEQQFHECLLNAPQAAAARDYLHSRGFTAQTIAAFRLGYHPNEWEWLLHRARGKFSLPVLTAAKLVAERDNNNGFYDYFVNRVMFPIRDRQKRPVAFGGRILPGEKSENTPKYFNSLESIIFTKSQLLYGLDHARDAIGKTETAVVVEGYTDCITAHQYGQQNVVATLGTALAETHVTNLKRFVRNVVLVFDGDTAGKDSTDRALSKFLAQEVNLRILTLADGLDPADFLEQQGGEAFAELVQKAPEAWQHKLKTTIAKYGLETIDAKDHVLNEMLEVVAAVPHSGNNDAGKWRNREDLILGTLVQRLGLKEQAVRQRLGEIRKQSRNRQQPRQTQGPQRFDSPETTPAVPIARTPIAQKQIYLERELLQILLVAPSVIKEIQTAIPYEDFQRYHRLRALLKCCYAYRGLTGRTLTFIS